MPLSITAGGFVYPPAWNGSRVAHNVGAPSNLTIVAAIDAAGEKNAFIGNVYWAGKPASKIISSAGGKLHLNWGNLSFSSASSIIGIGIQSLSDNASSLRPTGTFLVSTTLTGSNPSPLLSLTSQAIAMASGVVTLSHGAICAVVVDLSAAGAGDVVNLRGVNHSGIARQIPTCTNFTTGWSGTFVNIPTVLFEADDGTLGWFSRSMPGITTITSVSITSGSTLNEYGMLFSMPFAARIDELIIFGNSVNSAADGTVVLYSNPKGTPVTITSYPFDGAWWPGGGVYSYFSFPITNPVTITSSTTYMMSVLATGTAAMRFDIANIGSSAHKSTWIFGDYFAVGNRSSGGGSSFSVQQLSALLGWGVRINEISISAAAASAGMLVHPGMTGGYRG